MSDQGLTLPDVLLNKMKYHEARQKAIAQNIANADTPGYQPVDISAPDFKQMLGDVTMERARKSVTPTSVAKTNSQHMALGGGGNGGDVAKAKASKNVYETSPDGNASILEEQLLKANVNDADHKFASNLYQKIISLLHRSTESR